MRQRVNTSKGSGMIINSARGSDNLVYEVLLDGAEDTQMFYCNEIENIENVDKIKPKHYPNKIDVIDFCQANNVGFNEGNIIKYIVRYKDKNGLEDLLKAQEYLKRLIKHHEQTL